MSDEIVKVKKNGNLIAFDTGSQYWLFENVVYSIRVDGCRINVWCCVDRLDKHLRRLYQVIGCKFFTESRGMVIVDKDFISKHSYA